MTAADYIRRINHAFTAVVLSDDNPFRATVAARLESMGGRHCAPPTADRFTRRDDPLVEIARETALAKQEGGTPF